MSKNVIIDYGMGNLRSVQKAIERVGYSAVVSDDAEAVRSADKLILPGVGAFADAMAALREKNLVEPVCEFIRTGKPFLGICLGLQLLFDTSRENGEHTGFGIIEGTVEPFERRPVGGKKVKVPHMGWNRIRIRAQAPVLAGVPDNAWMYFVHSYYVKPADSSFVAAETDYSITFASMVWKNNIFATQFHPEKSQAHGLRLLARAVPCPYIESSLQLSAASCQLTVYGLGLQSAALWDGRYRLIGLIRQIGRIRLIGQTRQVSRI